MRPLAFAGASRRAAHRAFLAAGLAVAAISLGTGCPVQARPTGLGNPIAFSELPPEAQQTEKLIFAGGPFPYARDGVVFMNREGRLERHPRGYYHEYTVPTPGAHDRGARRVICGGTRKTEPDACFYTEDHYNSFHRILN